MGKRGPAPKPTKLKLLSGTARKDRMVPDEMAPDAVAPAAPDWLDGEAREEWERVVPELAMLGVLTLVDRAALVGYCVQWAKAVRLDAVLAAEGETFVTPKGYICQRPEWAMSRGAWQEVRAFGDRFGLNPSARTRVSVPKKEAPKRSRWAEPA